MKGGSRGAGGAAVQVAPLALGLLGESAAAAAAVAPGGLWDRVWGGRRKGGGGEGYGRDCILITRYTLSSS